MKNFDVIKFDFDVKLMWQLASNRLKTICYQTKLLCLIPLRTLNSYSAYMILSLHYVIPLHCYNTSASQYVI